MPTQSERLTLCVYERESERQHRARWKCRHNGCRALCQQVFCLRRVFGHFFGFFYQLLTPLVVVVAIDLFVVVGGFCVVAV